jgi:hypothetical protein
MFWLHFTFVWKTMRADLSWCRTNEVITAKTVKFFEINLDKYWKAQEFKYDHTANINLTSKPGSDVKSRSSIVEEEVK